MELMLDSEAGIVDIRFGHSLVPRYTPSFFTFSHTRGLVTTVLLEYVSHPFQPVGLENGSTTVNARLR
jgi:hypothetical protein